MEFEMAMGKRVTYWKILIAATTCLCLHIDLPLGTTGVFYFQT